MSKKLHFIRQGQISCIYSTSVNRCADRPCLGSLSKDLFDLFYPEHTQALLRAYDHEEVDGSLLNLRVFMGRVAHI